MKNTVFPHKFWRPFLDCVPQFEPYVYDDVIKWKLFSALMALCVGNSPVTSEFLSQRPVTWSFDVFFDLLNKPSDTKL